MAKKLEKPKREEKVSPIKDKYGGLSDSQIAKIKSDEKNG